MKKVTAEDLQVGMFVNGTAGSWIDHGLWRTRFLITDVAMLESARRCGAKEFWIDLNRSLLQRHDHASSAEPRASVAANDCAAAQEEPLEQATTLAAEVARAAKICRNARAAVATLFEDVSAGRPPDAEAAKPIIDEIVASVRRNSGALISLARLKSKDDYTFMHSVSVCALMVALGRQLGHDDAMCRRFGLAGLFHDIGKALVPLEVLNKPGKLSDEEFSLVKTHSARGHELLLGTDLTDAIALDVVHHHHEKIDGSGYPDRLAGEQISLAARMGAICDVYDAVTSTRTYKEAWDPADALVRMASWHGHFDRSVLATFIRMIGIYPPGSLVRLKSDRLAIVIENHSDALHKPIVKVFYSMKSQVSVPTEVLDLAQPGMTETIVAREPRSDWSAAFLDSLSNPALLHA